MVLVALACGGGLFYYAKMPTTFAPTPQSFVIERGQTGAQVIQMMTQRKMVTSPFLFSLVLKFSGRSSQIKAGSYEISSPVTPYQLIQKLTDGDVQSATWTLIEGWNMKDIRLSLAKNPHIRHDSATMSDAELLKAIGVKEPGLEGVFFPDTYHFSKQSSDVAVLKRAYALMQKNLQQAFAAKAADNPIKTPYELLILASIVEKETGKPSDRELIAGVFANRLRIGMRLQTDPTVIYGMGERYKKGGRIETTVDTIYNTYTRAGLPPTPIAMPGRAALFAAALPAKTKAMYFIGKRTGESHFSETLAEHNRAINIYLRGR
jgi:UPF0755 protein